MLGESVTRIRAGAATTTDGHGNDVPGAAVESLIGGALFAPGGSQEPTEPGRAAVVTVPTLYFPHAWPDIAAADRIRVRGLDYEVIGDPADWRSPVGTTTGGLVVQLRKVTG